MRFLAFIARILLGLNFVVFGLNGFLNFIKVPAMHGHAADFIGAMVATKYMWVVKGLEVVGGALLLLGRVPLGLTLLGPVVVNIVLFDALMDRSSLPMAAVIGALSLFLLWRNQESFPALFPKSEPAKKPAKK
jgi:uncharacterized membrane protein YphA (DoxX/SURF4 family)